MRRLARLSPAGNWLRRPGLPETFEVEPCDFDDRFQWKYKILAFREDELIFLDEDDDRDMKTGRRGIKPPLDLLPLWALEGVSRVFEYGNRKYAPGNWLKAAKDGEQALGDYIAAAFRHWAAMQRHGWSALDDESGLPHIDHLLASVIMLRGIGIKASLLPGDPGRGNEVDKD